MARKIATSSKAPSSLSAQPAAPETVEDLDAAESIGYLIRDAHRTFMRSIEARIGQHGITSGMWWFLRRLWVEDGVSQAELSEQLHVMGPTTVRAMDRLERSGLIERRQSASDKRKAIIFLTEKGRALRVQLMPYAHEVQDIALSSLSDIEAQILRSLLVKVTNSVAADEMLQPVVRR